MLLRMGVMRDDNRRSEQLPSLWLPFISVSSDTAFLVASQNLDIFDPAPLLRASRNPTTPVPSFNAPLHSNTQPIHPTLLSLILYYLSSFGGGENHRMVVARIEIHELMHHAR